jgi:hypothetical protein
MLLFMKKIICLISTLILLVSLVSCGGSKVEKIEVVFDATKFIVDDERTVTEAELIDMLGEPESIEEWNYQVYQELLLREVEYPIRSLFYQGGTYEYKFNNDHLQRITINMDIPYNKKSDILPLFGLSEYSNSEITDTGVAYRVTNCGVYDFWVTKMDNQIIHNIHISYGNLF